ncbi:LacI family DNA-binding transcriptional regulator [Glycomyces sp. NRRL B-16210]|uniref:LacI family DNA-binding transcriptional regulator n=1 Tax=Glycomyces sp. NRRL B-16210 TaxID=1463821 RepID=UPI0004BFC57E|nr:LacI family DNA-binding transcriptional regulator [Glycomyces sp. NRRL B-16210]
MTDEANTGRKPTMTDVAALAGVSVMTVSNVINRPDVVAEATREKVHTAMRRLRYRNNLVARSLRLTQPRQIGYVLPAQDANQYMDAFLHDLAAACQAADRNLTLVTEHDTDALLTACENLYLGRSVAGFILSNIGRDDPRPAELHRRGIPFAAYGRSATAYDSDWSWAEGDAAQGIQIAVDHLVDLGHRELALTGADTASITMTERETGYRDACTRHGLHRSTRADRILHCPGDLESGVRTAARLLDTPTPPTAIVCVSDLLAAGTLITLQARGLTPGRDIAVTGYDDTPLTSFGTVGITSVRQASHRIATELVRLVIDPPPQPEHHLLPPTLITRTSTDPHA